MRNKSEIKKAIKDPDFNWLGRKPFIDDFIKHLNNQIKSRHICINGVWGSGKTTTVLGIIDQLKKIEEQIKPSVLYLDAWKYEHYQDPLFALLKVMQKKLPEIFEIIKNDFQRKGIEPQVGLNLPFFNIALSKNREDTFNRLLNESEYIDALNETMITAVKTFKEENSNDLIIFIDELDRAKPDFALRTIEMFHHLQDELPTHIVYSVDVNQLSSIIKHY
ncbi:MAG TPA: P-loop NTPase fold protein, partial [Pseudogracilibacillus sp.]|nr:P-loop NTPase fold protein [Pseudogracilibacillus sp.]